MDHLAEIKRDERETLEAIRRGDDRVPMTRPFTPQQLKLRQVLADDYGHLWLVGERELVKLSGPVRA